MEDQADHTLVVTCRCPPLAIHPSSLFPSSSQNMSTPRAIAIKPRPSSTRHSKITVEYHRPSRESVQEYGALLDQANLEASFNTSSNLLPSLTPSRPAPPPPPSVPSSFKPKDPLSSTTTPPPFRTRNSLQKPPPRNRKPSIQTNTIRANHTTDPSVPNNTDLSPIKSSYSHSNGSSPTVVSPPRPSRANTSNLNDLFSNQSVIAQRRISTPVIGSTGFPSAADPAPHVEDDDPHSAHPVLNPIVNFGSTPQLPSSFTTNGTGTTRARSATVTKGKKGMLGFVSDLLGSTKRVEISTPYDPVHLTHVGFNTSTGEFTGLPKEWQQLLQESGISRTEQEKNPEAVMEIVKFYQEGGGGGDVWDKMGGALKDGPPVLPAPPPSKPLMDDSFYTPVRHFNPSIPAFGTDVRQRQTQALSKRPQQPTLVTQSTSPATQLVTPSPSRTTPISPSNRPGLDRSVSARTQTKSNSPAMSRSNTTKEARSTSDRHTPHQQQSQTQQSAHHHHQHQQQQTLPTPTQSKPTANAQPSPNKSSTDPQTRHKPKQPINLNAHGKPGTGLNPPGAGPRRREKKDKEDDSEIISKLRQICTDADPTRLYRNLVKIGAG